MALLWAGGRAAALLGSRRAPVRYYRTPEERHAFFRCGGRVQAKQRHWGERLRAPTSDGCAVGDGNAVRCNPGAWGEITRGEARFDHVFWRDAAAWAGS